MATIPSGTPVFLLSDYETSLAFPPPAEGSLFVAVHEGALRVGARNPLTQIAALEGGTVTWMGALDERMLIERDGPREVDVGTLVAWVLGRGRFGEVIWPGDLVCPPGERLFTVYQKSRPWIIVGGLDDGSPVAAPLNDATNPLWFTPVIEAHDQIVPNAKRVQVELAHLWSFPANAATYGSVNQTARETIVAALRAYFGAA
jgi:hypothetical protein